MAASVAVLRDAAAERAALAAAQVEESRAKAKRAARIEALAGRFETQAAVALQDVTAAASRLDGTAMLMSEAAGESTTRAVSVAGASHLASQSVQTGIPPVTTT
jgi:methyl-accepting chemotaxis protein